MPVAATGGPLTSTAESTSNSTSATGRVASLFAYLRNAISPNRNLATTAVAEEKLESKAHKVSDVDTDALEVCGLFQTNPDKWEAGKLYETILSGKTNSRMAWQVVVFKGTDALNQPGYCIFDNEPSKPFVSSTDWGEIQQCFQDHLQVALHDMPDHVETQFTKATKKKKELFDSLDFIRENDGIFVITGKSGGIGVSSDPELLKLACPPLPGKCSCLLVLRPDKKRKRLAGSVRSRLCKKARDTRQAFPTAQNNWEDEEVQMPDEPLRGPYKDMLPQTTMDKLRNLCFASIDPDTTNTTVPPHALDSHDGRKKPDVILEVAGTVTVKVDLGDYFLNPDVQDGKLRIYDFQRNKIIVSPFDGEQCVWIDFSGEALRQGLRFDYQAPHSGGKSVLIDETKLVYVRRNPRASEEMVNQEIKRQEPKLLQQMQSVDEYETVVGGLSLTHSAKGHRQPLCIIGGKAGGTFGAMPIERVPEEILPKTELYDKGSIRIPAINVEHACMFCSTTLTLGKHVKKYESVRTDGEARKTQRKAMFHELAYHPGQEFFRWVKHNLKYFDSGQPFGLKDHAQICLFDAYNKNEIPLLPCQLLVQEEKTQPLILELSDRMTRAIVMAEKRKMGNKANPVELYDQDVVKDRTISFLKELKASLVRFPWRQLVELLPQEPLDKDGEPKYFLRERLIWNTVNLLFIRLLYLEKPFPGLPVFDEGDGSWRLSGEAVAMKQDEKKTRRKKKRNSSDDSSDNEVDLENKKVAI